MRGITLEEISEATKISVRNLRALEQEDFAHLPGGIFNKGFVRAYARFLGLDEEETIADYLAAEENHQPETPPNSERPKELASDDEKPPMSIRGIFRIVIGLVLLAGGIAVWNEYSDTFESAFVRLHDRYGTREAETLPPPTMTPPAPPADALPNTAPAVQTDKGSPAKPPAVKKVAQMTTAVPNDDSVAADSVTVVAAKVSSKPQAPEPRYISDMETNGAPDPDAFEVIIRAREKAWIAATADGKAVFSDILEAAAIKTFHARKQLVVTTGNAGGVEISFDGKDLGPAGEPNKKRVLTFTPEGLQQ